MIAELAGSITAIRESFNLVKVIGDAKTDAEVQAATFELRNKLQDIQMENLKLTDLIFSLKAQIAELEQQIKNQSDFVTKASAYTPHTLESGTFTYIVNSTSGSVNEARYLCANCYENSVISVLQPNPTNPFHRGYFISYCPKCRSEFRMHKTPPIEGFPIS